jgi:hypothetical protein
MKHGAKLQLAPPPARAKRLPGEAGPVVLQALLPQEEIVVNQSAYKWAGGQSKKVPVFVYNFGAEKVTGRLTANGPEGWQVSLPATAAIAPGERKELELELACSAPTGSTEGTIRITGDFGAGGKAVLSVRFVPSAK